MMSTHDLTWLCSYLLFCQQFFWSPNILFMLTSSDLQFIFIVSKWTFQDVHVEPEISSIFLILYNILFCWMLVKPQYILFSCVCDNNTHLCDNCELWCENWRLNKLNWIELNPMNPMVKLKEPKRTNVQTLNRIFVYLASFVRSTFGQRITLNFLAFTMFKERN